MDISLYVIASSTMHDISMACINPNGRSNNRGHKHTPTATPTANDWCSSNKGQQNQFKGIFIQKPAKWIAYPFVEAPGLFGAHMLVSWGMSVLDFLLNVFACIHATTAPTLAATDMQGHLGCGRSSPRAIADLLVSLQSWCYCTCCCMSTYPPPIIAVGTFSLIGYCFVRVCGVCVVCKICHLVHRGWWGLVCRI
jgi:hypothetical protein